MKRLAVVAAAVALGLGAVAPALAVNQSTHTYTFDTTLIPQYFGAGAYEGVLRLTITADGRAMGTYRDLDSARVQTVTGGLDGSKIWLDLGQGIPPVEGTFDGRKIEGSTTFDNQPFAFEAKPENTADF